MAPAISWRPCIITCVQWKLQSPTFTQVLGFNIENNNPLFPDESSGGPTIYAPSAL